MITGNYQKSMSEIDEIDKQLAQIEKMLFG